MTIKTLYPLVAILFALNAVGLVLGTIALIWVQVNFASLDYATIFGLAAQLAMGIVYGTLFLKRNSPIRLRAL